MESRGIEERLIRCEKAIARHSAVLELRQTVIARLAWGAHPLVQEQLEEDLERWEQQARKAELANPNPPAAAARDIKHDAFLAEIAFIRSALRPGSGHPGGDRTTK